MPFHNALTCTFTLHLLRFALVTGEPRIANGFVGSLHSLN